MSKFIILAGIVKAVQDVYWRMFNRSITTGVFIVN